MKTNTSIQLHRTALAAMLATAFGNLYANPVAPTVVSGAATFVQQGNVYNITNTPNTIINWGSFSIAAGEITRFIQQSSDSRVLNRITGQDPSQILGSLLSNGKVFLINPNGVIFGVGSRVDVSGLVASSLNISNADFLAGKNIFSGSGDAGKVSNQGTITTPSGGQIFLIAPSVENTGIISAPNGDVMLAAGRSVQLFDSTDPNLQVVVSAPTDQAINLGTIVAAGGRVGVFGALVNQRGTINADSAVQGENGKIVLKASDTTLVEAGSVTSAKGTGQNAGGEILALGAKVGVTGDAVIDAGGTTGGGTVLIGGDYQGKNAAVMNADASYVGQDAVIRADATGNGDGGTIVVWGKDVTRMYGSLSARGGADGGDGGRVETSADYLDVAGARVDTRAARGKTGNWLLDPYDIDVVSGRGGALSDALTFNAGSSTGTTVIGADLISESSTNVILQAKHDITFSSTIYNDTGASLTAQAGNDIVVNAPLFVQGGITLSANDAASGSASGVGGVTIGDMGGNDVIRTDGTNLSLRGTYVTINGAIDLGGGSLDARANVADGYITLGSNSVIRSDSASQGVISFVSDNLNFYGAAGSIGGGDANGYDSVSIRTYSANREVVIGGAVSGKLGLSAAGLNSIATSNLIIGHSAAGNISTAGDVALSSVGSLLLESGGDITLSNALNGARNYTISVDGSGVLSTATGASITAANAIALVGNNMSLNGGTLSATTISVDAYGTSTGINLGSEVAGKLSLTNAELLTLHSDVLNIGTSQNNTGALTVGGAVDLTGGSAATQQLNLSGSAVTVSSALTTSGQLNLTGTAGSVSGAGTITADNLVANGTAIALSGANAVGGISGQATTGSFAFNAAGDLGITGALGGATGVSLTAGGNITQDSASVLTTPLLSVSTPGRVRLDAVVNHIDALAATSVGSLAVNNSGAIQLNDITLTGNYVNGAVNIAALGNVAVSGALNAKTQSVDLSGANVIGSGVITAGILNANAGGSVTLSGDNQATIISGTTANGAFSYNSVANYTVGNISAGTLISLSGSGNISQAAGSSILSAPQLDVTTSGAVSLLGSNQISTLTATNVGSLAFRDDTNLSLGAISLATASTGTIDIVASTVTVNGTINGREQTVSLAGNSVSVNAAGSAGVFNIGADELTLSANLSASIAASIHPYSSGYSMRLGSGSSCGTGCLAVNDLWHMVTPTLALGSTDAALNVGPITVDSLGGTGSTSSSINALTNRVALLSNAGDVSQTGVINVRDLAIQTSGNITLTNSGNTVSNLAVSQAGSGNLSFANTGALAIASLSGGPAQQPLFDIGGVNSNGSVTLDVLGALTTGSGLVQGGTITADSLVLNTTGGAGTVNSPLLTKVNEITVVNTAGSGATAGINVANTNNSAAQLVVHDIRQVDAGGGNGGGISLSNHDGMAVAGTVATTSGAIVLNANGPLTIDGAVNSDSGNIALAAGTTYHPDNILTIGSGAIVLSVNGAVTMTATSYTSNGGTVVDSAGAVVPTLIPDPATLPVTTATTPTTTQLAAQGSASINQLVNTLTAANNEISNPEAGRMRAVPGDERQEEKSSSGIVIAQ